MVDLPTEVRKNSNLFSAWLDVRARGRSSNSTDVRTAIGTIDKNPVGYIRSLHEELRQGSYKPAPQRGYPKKKSSGGYRGLVVATVRDRIVQRAMLNVLQSELKPVQRVLGRIPQIIATRTSIGGLPEKGVGRGISLVREANSAGAKYFLRSDIKDFFTKVPKKTVVECVRANTNDDKFAELFELLLSTELENPEEVKEYLHLFPSDETGVPQGSSLSAFAGNVILKEFDDQLNAMGVTALRYIDDFVLLGPTQQGVQQSFHKGKTILKKLGMTAYIPNDGSKKSEIGAIANGFNFLGCRINSTHVGPSRQSRQKLLTNVRGEINEGRAAICKFKMASERRRAERVYSQTLSRVDLKIRGWGDSFQFCNDRQPFTQLDQELDKMIEDFRGFFGRHVQDMPLRIRRRMLGVALLCDTRPCSLN